jgi:hypothetical protein
MLMSSVADARVALECEVSQATVSTAKREMSREVTVRGRRVKYVAPGLYKVQGSGASWAVNVDETRVEVGGRLLFTISLLGRQTGIAHDCCLLRGDRNCVPTRLTGANRAKNVVTQVQHVRSYLHVSGAS